MGSDTGAVSRNEVLSSLLIIQLVNVSIIMFMFELPIEIIFVSMVLGGIGVVGLLMGRRGRT